MEEKENAKQVPEITDEELEQVTGGKKVDFKPVVLTPVETPGKDEKGQGTSDQQ